MSKENHKIIISDDDKCTLVYSNQNLSDSQYGFLERFQEKCESDRKSGRGTALSELPEILRTLRAEDFERYKSGELTSGELRETALPIIAELNSYLREGDNVRALITYFNNSRILDIVLSCEEGSKLAEKVKHLESSVSNIRRKPEQGESGK